MKTQTYDGYSYGDLGYPEMYENLLPLIKAGQLVLDLGIGTGHICSPIAFAGLKITGVDNNSGRLEVCEEAFTEAGLGLQLTTVHADALEYLRGNDAQYDLVVLSDFLMFLKKTAGKEILKLAYESLHLGGYLWITTISSGDDFYARMSGSQEPIDTDTFLAYSHCAGSNPICFYHPNEIEMLLESLGASISFGVETVNDSGGVFNIVLARKPA